MCKVIREYILNCEYGCDSETFVHFCFRATFCQDAQTSQLCHCLQMEQDLPVARSARKMSPAHVPQMGFPFAETSLKSGIRPHRSAMSAMAVLSPTALRANHYVCYQRLLKSYEDSCVQALLPVNAAMLKALGALRSSD